MARLLDRLRETHPVLVGEVVPGRMDRVTLHQVLKLLVGEQVSIRDLPAIPSASPSTTEGPG